MKVVNIGIYLELNFKKKPVVHALALHYIIYYNTLFITIQCTY